MQCERLLAVPVVAVRSHYLLCEGGRKGGGREPGRDVEGGGRLEGGEGGEGGGWQGGGVHLGKGDVEG